MSIIPPNPIPPGVFDPLPMTKMPDLEALAKTLKKADPFEFDAEFKFMGQTIKVKVRLQPGARAKAPDGTIVHLSDDYKWVQKYEAKR